MTTSNSRTQLERLLSERILVLDGAMGTMIQAAGLSEADFRGARFADHSVDLKGDNELLVLTRPDVIEKIHGAFLAAGADIIETNPFGSTSVSQADYAMGATAYEQNVLAAKIAKRVAAEWTARTPDKPRFVAGAIGPTNKTLSISPDVNDPSFRDVTFDVLREAYAEQIRALVEGGADVLLIETVFDTLNAKAAIVAAFEVFEEHAASRLAPQPTHLPDTHRPQHLDQLKVPRAHQVGDPLHRIGRLDLGHRDGAGLAALALPAEPAFQRQQQRYVDGYQVRATEDGLGHVLGDGDAA